MSQQSTVHLASLSAATSVGCAAVAACSFGLQGTPQGNGRWLLQLTPAQDFTPSDGREMSVPAWRINAEIAQRVIHRFNPAQPPVIDYEHQTLHKEANGQPAPAAGWMHGLRWVDGKGLFAEVELTARAQAAIEAGEYRYFSPVFLYAKDGEVLHITMGALTNHPAVHGMQALNAMQAAASAQFSSPAIAPPEDAMTLLQHLLASLGLPDTTDEKTAMAALSAVGSIAALQAKANAAEQASQVASAACAALNLPVDAKAEAVTAALTAATTSKLDPAKFVPLETVTAMQAQLAALTAKQQAADIDAVIQPALADGRLLPPMEAWARDLGKTDMAALTSYLASAQPVAALTSTQTLGNPPAQTAKGDAQLSASEVAVCAAMGLSAEQYKAGAV